MQTFDVNSFYSLMAVFEKALVILKSFRAVAPAAADFLG